MPNEEEPREHRVTLGDLRKHAGDEEWLSQNPDAVDSIESARSAVEALLETGYLDSAATTSELLQDQMHIPDALLAPDISAIPALSPPAEHPGHETNRLLERQEDALRGLALAQDEAARSADARHRTTRLLAIWTLVIAALTLMASVVVPLVT